MSEVYAPARDKSKVFPFVGVSSDEVQSSYQQHLDLLLEPQILYHRDQQQHGARFALCCKGADGRVMQDLFDVSKLDWAISQIQKMPARDQTHFWISQATLAAGARNRRISSIVGLNAVWCDIDLAHPPKYFLGKLPEGDLSKSAVVDRLATLLAMQLADAGLPVPTYIVATGGGLCPKWVFEFSVPSAARARWQSLQNKIVSKVGSMKGDLGGVSWAWPVDRAASDAARVLRLVGSVNPRWQTPCRIAWQSGKQFDFDYLADEILDYTRADVVAYREKARVKREAGMQWDANRAAAVAAGIRTSRAAAALDPIVDEAARGLWALRFEFGRSVIAARGGASEGNRNNHFWPLANALAHSCSSVDQLLQEIAALHHSHFRGDGWTRGEAMQSAATVMERLKRGTLYRMKTQTFVDALDVTLAERRAHGRMLVGDTGHNSKRAEWETGAMGFERMQDLSSDAYIAETRRRQALAGSRSASTRKTTYSEDVRDKARTMRSSGLGVQKISIELGIPKGTISKWLKAHE